MRAPAKPNLSPPSCVADAIPRDAFAGGKLILHILFCLQLFAQIGKCSFVWRTVDVRLATAASWSSKAPLLP
jgi:hypothetical protein